MGGLREGFRGGVGEASGRIREGFGEILRAAGRLQGCFGKTSWGASPRRRGGFGEAAWRHHDNFGGFREGFGKATGRLREGFGKRAFLLMSLDAGGRTPDLRVAMTISEPPLDDRCYHVPWRHHCVVVAQTNKQTNNVCDLAITRGLKIVLFFEVRIDTSSL